MTIKKIAPIAYFAFNRPEHTLQSLEAIKSNSLSAETEIYIFCDGPRANETVEGLANIESVRAICESKTWAKTVHLKFRPNNVGLFQSITSGITDVVNTHGRVIVVEDDVVVSPGFLQFENDCLDLYENDEQVMHVSGYCPFDEFPIKYNETTFFYNHTYCWGWGTWKRAWDYFEADGYKLMKGIRASKRMSYINLDNTFQIYWGLKYIHERKFQDWNYNWHASVALQNGLSIHPTKTLINNIGFDGSGTHCTTDGSQKLHSMGSNIRVKRIALSENAQIRSFVHKLTFKARAKFLVAHWLRFIYFFVKQ